MAALSTPGHAAAGDPQLLARQQALFEQSRADPSNLELLFDYAMVSVELEDYEPAISALERMLIFNADLPRVKLELGAAYYRLGAYDAAEVYFDEVLDSDPPPRVRERIEQFRTAIAERQDERSKPFSGYVSTGFFYSTNANLGPDEREIDAAILGGTGFLRPEDTAAEDFGWRASGLVQHQKALPGREGDAWLTTLSGTTIRFFKEEQGNLDAVRLSTGPSLSFGQGFGAPRVRPFADIGYVRSGNDGLYASYGGGADYSNGISQRMAVFGNVSAQYRDYVDQDEFDGLNLGAGLGIAYGPTPQTILRAGVFGDTDLTDEQTTENWEAGLRASAEHRYKPGVAALPDKPWIASAYAQASRRWYDGPDPTIDPDKTRRDWDVTLGVANAVPVWGDVSVVGNARYFNRSSNIRNFDLDSFEVGVDVRLAF